jgi:hypothetical protein
MKLVKDKFQISAVICMPQHQEKLGENEIINSLQEECSCFTINAQDRSAALLGTRCLAQLLHMHDKPSHRATGRTWHNASFKRNTVVAMWQNLKTGKHYVSHLQGSTGHSRIFQYYIEPHSLLFTRASLSLTPYWHTRFHTISRISAYINLTPNSRSSVSPGFPTKSSFPCPTCLAYLTLLDVTILIIFGKRNTGIDHLWTCTTSKSFPHYEKQFQPTDNFHL